MEKYSEPWKFITVLTQELNLYKFRSFQPQTCFGILSNLLMGKKRNSREQKSANSVLKDDFCFFIKILWELFLVFKWIPHISYAVTFTISIKVSTRKLIGKNFVFFCCFRFWVSYIYFTFFLIYLTILNSVSFVCFAVVVLLQTTTKRWKKITTTIATKK